MPNIERKESTERLKCVLDDTEKLKVGQVLADELGDLRALEDELKSVKAQYKDKMETCQARVNELQRLLSTGYELRVVKVWVELDYDQGMVFRVRADTGETIEQRPMTDDERQRALKFEGKAA